MLPLPRRHAWLAAPERVKESPSDIGATSKEKNNIVIPEFSAWLTLVLEQCRAENIRNLPRQRAPTPLFPERRPREACSMPISGCHDLPLATFNLPSRVFRHGCRRAECLERRWGGFFHTLSRGQHMPPQRLSVQPQNNPPNKNPSCRHSVAACVSDHSRGQAPAPATALKTNGDSPPSSFRNFPARPSRDGKYPESPATAGRNSTCSHNRPQMNETKLKDDLKHNLNTTQIASQMTSQKATGKTTQCNFNATFLFFAELSLHYCV